MLPSKTMDDLGNFNILLKKQILNLTSIAQYREKIKTFAKKSGKAEIPSCRFIIAMP